MANRISELEAHLRQWESDKRRRTAGFTLIPIAAALGVGWYAYDRIDTVEKGVDRTLTALDMPAEQGAGTAARLARLEELGSELQTLRPLPTELATVGEERAAAEAALAAAESELAASREAAAALTEERDRLAAELEETTAATDERLAQAGAELDALRAEQAELQRRAELVERERAALSEIANERQAALDAAGDAQAETAAQLQALGTEQGAVRESLVAQLATAGSRMAALEQELAQERASDAVAVDERIAELERQLQLAERTTAGLQTVRDDLDQRLAETEDALIAAEAAAREQQAASEAALAEATSRSEANAAALASRGRQLTALQQQLRQSEETAAGLQAERDDLERRLAETASTLLAAEAAAKEELAARDAALAAQSDDLAELERQLQLAERTVAGLQTVRDDLEQRLAETDDALIAAETAAQEALAAHEAALAEATSRSEANAAALASRGRQLAELQQQLQQAAATVAGLQATRDDLEQRLAASEDALGSAEAAAAEQVAALQSELAARDAALAELASGREADAAALAARGDDLAELERQLQLAERTTAGLQAVRDDLEARLAKTEDALIATEATESERVAALRAQLAERERELAASTQALAELEDRRVAEVAVLESQGAELAELERQLQLSERTAAGLQAVRDDLEARLAEAEDALIASEATDNEAVTALQAELAATEAALAEAESRREADDAALASRGVELAELQRRLELADWSRGGLQAARDDLETELAAAEAALAEAESRREADAAALASRGVELAELQRRLELADWSRNGLQATRDELEEQLAAAETAGSERLTALQAELAGREAELAAAAAALAESESRREADAAALASRGVELAELQRRLELADWSRNGLQATRDDLESELAAAETALAESESRREADAAALASRGVELAELQRRLELADWSRNGLQATRDDLEGDLAATEMALAEAESRREADAAALASRGVELAELQRRLELADWSRNGLQAARDDLEERLAAAEAREAALESELQATVASVPLAAGENARPIAEIVDLDEATRERLAAQAAELAELRATTEAQASLLAGREAELAALEAERQSEADQRLNLIGEQLGSSLRPLPVSRAAAEGAVEREMRLSSELLAAAGGGDDVALLSGRNVAFTAGLLFPSAEAELTPEGRAALNQIALELKQLVDALPDDLPWMLRIDGHTDDLPIRSGRFRSNWELAAARASSVAEYLVDWGLPEDRLIAAGFADTQPLVAGTSAEARSQNRRIELKLTVR